MFANIIISLVVIYITCRFEYLQVLREVICFMMDPSLENMFAMSSFHIGMMVLIVMIIC